MSAVVCFIRVASAGGGASAAWKVRKKEVLSVPSTSTITATSGEFAIILNTETSGILAAYGSIPDAVATTETAATSAGIGVASGLESALLGPLAEGDKISVKAIA